MYNFWKAFLIVIIILLFMSCSSKYYTPKEIAYGPITGIETSLISTGLKSNENIRIIGLEVQASNKIKNVRYGVESSIIQHKAKQSNPEHPRFEGILIDKELFVVYEKSLLKDWLIYGGLGIGLGLFITKSGDHDLIHQDGIIGVIDKRFGIKKYFNNSWFIDICYKMIHYSGLSAGDKGINADSIELLTGFSF